jgi:antitoxin component YwqK of YwqJK toxin-antitoxin module
MKGLKNPIFVKNIDFMSLNTSPFLLYADENGNVFEEVGFKKGLLNGRKTTWNPYGKLISEIEYSNGQLNGLSKIYQDGKIKQETNYIKGKISK